MKIYVYYIMIHFKEYNLLLPFNKTFEMDDECESFLNKLWCDYQIIFELYEKYDNEFDNNLKMIYINKKGVIENKISNHLKLNLPLNLKVNDDIDIEPIIYLMGKYKEKDIYIQLYSLYLTSFDRFYILNDRYKKSIMKLKIYDNWETTTNFFLNNEYTKLIVYLITNLKKITLENKKKISSELFEINEKYTFEWLDNKLCDAELMLHNVLILTIKNLIINYKYYNNK